MRFGFRDVKRIHQPPLGAVDNLAILQRAGELLCLLAQKLHACAAMRQRPHSLHQRILTDGVAQHHDVF